MKAPIWVRGGLVVLDCFSNPVLDYDNIPSTCSSEIEGWLQEEIIRMNPAITSKDFQARMRTDNLTNENALSVRRGRFRDSAGCISWNGRHGSDTVKAYMDRILPQACKAANSTRGFRDLNPDDIKAMHSQNAGKFPERSRHKRVRDESEDNDLEDQPRIKRTREEPERRNLQRQPRHKRARDDFEEIEVENHPRPKRARYDSEEGELDNEPTGFEDESTLSRIIIKEGRNDGADSDDTETEVVEGSQIAGKRVSEPMDTDLWEAVTNREWLPFRIGTGDFLLQSNSTIPRQRLTHRLLEPARLEFALWTHETPPATDPNASYFSQWWELQMAFNDQWIGNDKWTGNQAPPTLTEALDVSKERVVWKMYTNRP